MLRSRLIPVLLIRDGGLVKTRAFGNERYIGDPLNAVRIFNEKEVDELIVLDIDATRLGKNPNYSLIEKLAAESRMPLCYGGGITRSEQAHRIVKLGVEKVAIGAAMFSSEQQIRLAREIIGAQSLVGVIDVRKKQGLFGVSHQVATHNASKVVSSDPIAIAKKFCEIGVGELLINSIDRDGAMQGYDIELACSIREAVDVPMTVVGGAGSLDHVKELISACELVGAGAGSMFVYKGRLHGILINYPERASKLAVTEMQTAK